MRPASSANGISDSARKEDLTGMRRSPRSERRSGSITSFIMAATGDRVPTVFIENHRVVGYDSARSDSRQLRHAHRRLAHGQGASRTAEDASKPRPRSDHRQRHQPHRLHDRRKAALWKDEEMADVFTRQGRVVHRVAQERGRSFCISPRTIRMSRACRIRASSARPDLARAATPSSKPTGRSARYSRTLDRLGLTRNTLVIFTSDNGPVVDDGYKDDAVAKLGSHKPAGRFAAESTATSKPARGFRSSSAGQDE